MDAFSDWLDRNQNKALLEALESTLKVNNITPKKFPRVADMFSGNGAMSKKLISLGWLPSKIVCFDLYTPPKVKGVIHVSLDLFDLFHKIEDGNLDRLTGIKQQFDLITFTLADVLESGVGERGAEILAKFMVKPRGFRFDPVLNEFIK